MKRMILVTIIDIDNGTARTTSADSDDVHAWLISETMPSSFADDDALAQWLNNNPTVVNERTTWYDLPTITGDVYGVALATSRPCRIETVDALARYFFEGPFASEYYGTTSPDAIDGWGRLFLLNTDFTKSRHDDWTDYIGDLRGHLQEGSPVRRTDRKGPGTRGTRAVEGLRCDLWLAYE